MAISHPIHFSHHSIQYFPELEISAPLTKSIEHYTPERDFDVHAAWVVLKSPVTPPEEIYILRRKVKYLAVLPNMEGAVVLLDDGKGLLQPQTAFYIADNIIFVCDGSLKYAKAVRLVLYRNPVVVLTTSSGDGIIFSTVDLTSFLYSVGENVIIKSMLQTDGCYEVIDRYTLATAFIYLKRANLTDYYFTDILMVLAAMLLAHNMEEDDSPGRALTQLVFMCMPRGIPKREKTNFISSITSYQSSLFKKIAYRGYVKVEECEEVIAVAPYHPFWKRWRLSFHSGAVRDSYQNWKLQFIQASFPPAVIGSNNKCINCKGNHHYSQDIQDRFAMQHSFSTQKLHLIYILSCITETHEKNIQRAASCPETGHYFTNWSPTFVLPPAMEMTWPLEFMCLVEIENQIENILNDEKYLQKYITMLKTRKLFASFNVTSC